MVQGSGSKKGILAVSKGVRHFRNGTWQGKEKNNLCSASGTPF